jgi:hypothetical protein
MRAEDGCGSSSSSHSWKSYGIKTCYSPPVATSKRSAWFASAPFFAEPISAIACHRDLQRAVAFLEQIESFPEIAPKRQQFGLIWMTSLERAESLFRQARGKYLDGNVPLARSMNLYSQ